MYYFQQTTLLHSSCKELNMDDVGILFQNNKKHQAKQNTTKSQVTVPKQAKPPMNTRTN